MINKQFLIDKVNSSPLEGLYNITIDEPINYNGYILKNRPGTTYTTLYYPYNKVIIDNADYITIYSKELLDIEFDSLLIAGLGLGVQPYVCQEFAQIDVIEIDQNVIDINNQLGYLNENVNIIKDDILIYDPIKTYDIIILDIWWEAPTEELTDILISKYLPFVNEGGFLYFPINLDTLIDKTKISK